jgi:outer membrane protein assembly factor BamB
VSGGVVYVTGVTASANMLFAFDASGTQGCSGAPTVCAPLWTATFGPPSPDTDQSLESRSPAVAGGRVYVSGADHTVYAFDAAGQQNCGGVPKQCSALWTAVVPLTGAGGLSAPAVAGGVLYVTGAAGPGGVAMGGLFAFDAAGTKSCSGAPKQCSPIWTSNPTAAATRQPPAIWNGFVYIVAHAPSGEHNQLRAFDATGTQGCTGTPKTCQPIWTSTTELLTGAPTAANGVIYVVGTSGLLCPDLCTTTRHLYAFDASGVQGCAGTPKKCGPLLDWTDDQEFLTFADPVVKKGVVYVGDGEPLDTPFEIPLGVVHAFTV